MRLLAQETFTNIMSITGIVKRQVMNLIWIVGDVLLQEMERYSGDKN